MSSNRQLAAIMFTDIVGYTALMGKDEQKAFELLRKNRQIQQPLIKQYNGTWIKEIGDGVLASFNTVTDAVLCAGAIHKACNSVDGLQLRIGIHLGEVVFENNDVFGDGVNIASRLQALAPIGGTFVSETVYKNVSNKKEIITEYIREENLKNVSEPVKIYEIKLLGTAIFQPGTFRDLKKGNTIIPANKRKTAFGIGAFLILAAFLSWYFLVYQKKGSTSGNNTAEKSIAVLYFDNMTGDKEQEYLSDGLTEEITSRLAKIKGLRVISRTSVLPYKGKPLNIKKIAEELKVSTLLEGSVRKSGNTVRITAQLIDGKTDAHFWSQDFTSELNDIFELQADVAHAIAQKLEIEISSEANAKIREVSTSNIEAYDNYLKARHVAFNQYYYNGDSLAFERSRLMYEKAIELDPRFALAFAGQADLYDMKRTLGDSTDRVDSLRQSLSLKAYQLDSNSAFVNNVRIWMMANRKEPLLDSAFYYARKALKLDPGDYYNSHSIAGLLIIGDYGLSLFQLAIPFYEKATNLNPLDAPTFASLGYCYLMIGDLVKSNKAFQSAYELATTDQYFGVWWVLYWLIRSNRLVEAEQLYSKQNWGEINWARIYLMIVNGKQNEALKLIPKLTDPEIRANFYAQLNKKEDAINELKKVKEGKNIYLSLNIEPLTKFHGDPEFQKILTRQKVLHENYTKQYGKYVQDFIQ